MKKLLFSAVSLDVGGIETALVTLLNYLANERDEKEYRYQITLVLEKRQGLFLNMIDPKIKVMEYTPCQSKLLFIRKIMSFLKRMRWKKECKNQYDISIAYATYSLPASFVARTASKHPILWVHSEYLNVFHGKKDEYISFFEKVHVNEFQKVVFVSESARDTFHEIFSYNQKLLHKTEVIYNLIDDKTILQKSEEKIDDVQKEEIYTFLNVGRHTEEDKKLSRLIEAAKQLKDDNQKFRILLIGDGRNTNDYKKKVKEYDLEQEMIFLGRKENPYPYFKIADCFVLTSEYEGFPVVYNECMLLGLPIITTNVSDSKRVIQGTYGIVIEKKNEEIVDAMKKVLHQGIHVRERFNSQSWNQNIQEKITGLFNF